MCHQSQGTESRCDEPNLLDVMRQENLPGGFKPGPDGGCVSSDRCSSYIGGSKSLSEALLYGCGP